MAIGGAGGGRGQGHMRRKIAMRVESLRGAGRSGARLMAAFLMAGTLLSSARAFGGEGRIHELAEHIRPILTFEMSGRRIRLNRDIWKKSEKNKEEMRKEIEAKYAGRNLPPQFLDSQLRHVSGRPGVLQLFASLQSASGSHGVSSSQSGSTYRQSFRGNGLEARLYTAGPSGPFRMALDETAERRISLDVADDGKGVVRVLVTSGSGDFLLLVTQAEKRFTVVLVRGEKAVVKGAPTYFDFCRDEADFTEKTLIPLLADHGMAPPTSLYRPEVIEAVLLELRPFSDVDEKRVAELVKQLDHDEYAKREEASQILTRRLLRYRAAVSKEFKSGKAEAEAKMRMEKILEAPRAEKAVKIANDCRLASDADYLRGLLDLVSGPDRESVEAALAKIKAEEEAEAEVGD